MPNPTPQGMGEHAELHLPPDEQYVWLARLVVTVAARQAGMDDARVEDLKIAVSEATTNAIVAHKRSQQPRPVVLNFGVDDDGFSVTIVDTGPGFDPVESEALERDWQLEGGLGLTLIRGLADDVAFSRDSGMRVQMRFTVSLDGASGSPHRGSMPPAR